ncbi:MAG: methyltransferase domain-containing protein [Chloroflexia bacterium]
MGGVPVFLPGGAQSSEGYESELTVRGPYDPWVHRVVMQSLPVSAIILDIGAGNVGLNLPNVIRMDVTLTPYVDVVADAHALPFLPGSLDFVFSLAVVEHLRQPFVAAEEMYRVLREGGYAYNECNFVFAYHGYPHHYFNASEQGLEQVFSKFEKLRTGVAPYQMPSSALHMVLNSYLKWMSPTDDPQAQVFRLLLREVLEHPLKSYDALFTEEHALNVAAGVFFFGRKAAGGSSEVIPRPVMEAWEREPELHERFPRPFDLGSVPNLMLWAKGEGRLERSEIDEWFRSATPFRKNATVGESGRELFDALPVVPPEFVVVPDADAPPPMLPGDPVLQKRLETQVERAERMQVAALERAAYIERLEGFVEEKKAYMEHLEAVVRERDDQIRALTAPREGAFRSRLRGALRRLRRRRR